MTGKEWNGTKTKFSSLFALPCYFMERSHRFQLFHCRRKSLFAFALPCFSSIHVSRLLRKSKGMKMKPIVPCFQSLINSQVKSIYTFVMMMTGQVWAERNMPAETEIEVEEETNLPSQIFYVNFKLEQVKWRKQSLESFVCTRASYGVIGSSYKYM